MKNIIDYVSLATDSFLERPFNSVDSLILSQLVMLRFEHFVSDQLLSEDEAPTLAELATRSDIENIYLDVWHSKNARLLIAAVADSRRFGRIRVQYFVNRIDLEQERQFAAIIFLLEDGSSYISYRGTDETLVAWKEDFNMAFISPVPAQVDGLNYLLKWAAFNSRPLRLGGHSKGGNIAVYASSFAPIEIQDRIIKVYNHDGPGFLADFYLEAGYRRVRNKIEKTIPQSSVVGMLLENQDDYLIVKNVYPWFVQHNPFTWELHELDFAYRPGLDQSAINRANLVSSWLATMDEEARQTYINTLYEIVQATGASSFFDLTDDWQQRAKALIRAIKEMDDESKSFLKESIRSFFHLAAINVFEITETKTIK